MSEKKVTSLKISDKEGFEVELEVLPPVGSNYRQEDINAGLADCDARQKSLDARLKELNSEIDRLTNHADGIDYATAVVCGLIAGAMDSLYVGAWDFKDAKAKANKDINKRIEEFAKKCGFKFDPTKVDKNGKKIGSLSQAVLFLEKQFPMPGDGSFKGIKGAEFVKPGTHHLDDFCHHPTLVGLICNIIRQFTADAKYHDKNGKVSVAKDISVNTYDGTLEGSNHISKFFCGIINWFIVCAKTAANAKGHWYSDMAGTSQAIKAGKEGSGLPGSFSSLLKEFSSLPVFSKKDKKGNQTNAFAEGLRKAFQNGIGEDGPKLNLGPFNCLFEGASNKFDCRTEEAVKKLLGKQAIPVLLNEALVRSAYFIRRLIHELREKKSFSDVSWQKVLPFHNRTIARMLTISTATFTACDLADATIRSGVSNGFNAYNPKFWSDIILRVNFVGVGLFALAVCTDVGMGWRLSVKRQERMMAMNEHLFLNNAKIFYRQADLWIQLDKTERAVNEMIGDCVSAYKVAFKILEADEADYRAIRNAADGIEKNNPGLVNEIITQLDSI